MAAKTHEIDFSGVKDRGSFNPKQVPEGDYAAKIVKVEDGESKGDGGFQYIFTIKLEKYSQYAYPYYCKLQENQLWKIRNLLVAAGLTVPKKKLKVDPNKAVGKMIGVTMADDEYEGKMKSVIDAIFPASELSESDLQESSATGGDSNDDESVGEEAKGKKDKGGKKDKKKKKKDDDLEDLDISDV